MTLTIHTDTPRIPPALRWSVVGALGVLGIAGIFALVIRFVEGLGVTNLTSNVAWGMWVAFYIYCIGLSAGSFLMSTVIYVFGLERFERMGRMALVSALFALAGGLVFVWIDLGHPFRFYKVFVDWQASSVLAWEAMLYLVYIAIICSELYLLMRDDLAAARDDATGVRRRFYGVLALGRRADGTPEESARTARIVRTLGMIGVPVAIGVHGGTGALFAVVAAKPLWFSGLFPIVFLISALLSGAGLMLFLYSWFAPRDAHYAEIVSGLRSFVMAFIAIDLVLFASDVLVSLYSGIPDHTDVWHQIAFGPYWYVFWFGQIGMAWLLPLALTVAPTRRSATWLGAAGASIVAGILAVRLNLVIPAYLFPQLEGLDEALTDPRAAYSYFPSPVEWFSSLGVVAILVLAFMAAWKFLPLFESDPQPAVGSTDEPDELATGV
ncbi:MAG: molybdopterin oxidoreductase [Actinomyces sp.]|nr:MAG: molybdopterin oxidoreductase [Actinomyces sp.]